MRTGKQTCPCYVSKFVLKFLPNKEASTLHCSAVKHAGIEAIEHERSVRENTRHSRVFPCTLSTLRLPKSFTTEPSTMEASLFIHDKESVVFPMHSAEFSNQTLFSKRVKVASACNVL